jgi:hypothetical protein
MIKPKIHLFVDGGSIYKDGAILLLEKNTRLPPVQINYERSCAN